jgi:twitching motility protein PilT
MARLDSFLRLVVEQRASDLHFHAGNVPIVRCGGELLPLAFRSLSEEEAERFIFEVMTPEQVRSFQEDQEVDFAYELPDVGRFRAHAFRQSRGMGAVFRVIPSKLPTLDDLGLPPAVRALTSEANGLVLITGPTGSGKTTTLAAVIHEINLTSQKHIITIEDPIEFLHKPVKSVVTQREVGVHAESFASALRAAHRESPRVIVIGEMRDVETISLALSAAETGALVFATLHTKSASKAVDRIVDVMPEDSREQARSLLSVLLRGVVAQHLCKRASGDGLIAAIELMLQTYAVSHMIRENKVHQLDGYLQTAEQQQSKSGVQTLDGCLLRYLGDGLITLDEAVRAASDPDNLRRLARAPAETA